MIKEEKNLLKKYFFPMKWNDDIKVDNSKCNNCDSFYTIKTNENIEVVYKRLLNKIDSNIDKIIIVYADKIRKHSPIKLNVQKVEDNFVNIASFSL